MALITKNMSGHQNHPSTGQHYGRQRVRHQCWYLLPSAQFCCPPCSISNSRYVCLRCIHQANWERANCCRCHCIRWSSYGKDIHSCVQQSVILWWEAWSFTDQEPEPTQVFWHSIVLGQSVPSITEFKHRSKQLAPHTSTLLWNEDYAPVLYRVRRNKEIASTLPWPVPPSEIPARSSWFKQRIMTEVLVHGSNFWLWPKPSYLSATNTWTQLRTTRSWTQLTRCLSQSWNACTSANELGKLTQRMSLWTLLLDTHSSVMNDMPTWWLNLWRKDLVSALPSEPNAPFESPQNEASGQQ